MGQQYRGELCGFPLQAAEDIQVRGDLHHPGEDGGRPDRGLRLLLGHHHGRQLHRQVGESRHVLHCQRVRTCSVKQLKLFIEKYPF